MHYSIQSYKINRALVKLFEEEEKKMITLCTLYGHIHKMDAFIIFMSLSLETGQQSALAEKKSKNYEILFVCSVLNVVKHTP